MNKFTIYEFIYAGNFEIIPLHWVNVNKQVQWHEDAKKFIKRGKNPKSSWKFYDVKQVTSKTYETYSTAEVGLKKIVILKKTGIDIDELFEDANKTKIKNEISYVESSDDSSDDDSTADVDSLEDPLRDITSEDLEGCSNPSILKHRTQKTRKIPVISKVNSISQIPAVPDPEEINFFDENSTGFNLQDGGNNQENVNQTYAKVPYEFLNNILSILQNLQKDMDYMKSQLKSTNTDINILPVVPVSPELSSTTSYACKDMLPCKEVEELLKLEKYLEEKEENKNNFVNYLKTKLINERYLKEVTATFIETLYTLELQEKLNYSGVKGKMPLKDFASTHLLVKAIAETGMDLKDEVDRTEAIRKALREFRYQMQHTCDRIRSKKRKIMASVGMHYEKKRKPKQKKMN